MKCDQCKKEITEDEESMPLRIKGETFTLHQKCLKSFGVDHEVERIELVTTAIPKDEMIRVEYDGPAPGIVTCWSCGGEMAYIDDIIFNKRGFIEKRHGILRDALQWNCTNDECTAGAFKDKYGRGPDDMPKEEWKKLCTP